MRIEPYNYQYVHVQPEDCKEIVERTILEGQPVERLFYRDHETVCPHPDDIPFLNQQMKYFYSYLYFLVSDCSSKQSYCLTFAIRV